jgi:hypothetical protein
MFAAIVLYLRYKKLQFIRYLRKEGRKTEYFGKYFAHNHFAMGQMLCFTRCAFGAVGLHEVIYLTFNTFGVLGMFFA